MSIKANFISRARENIFAGNRNPKNGDGIDAFRGALYLRGGPDGVDPLQIYRKNDNGLSTNWSLVNDGSNAVSAFAAVEFNFDSPSPEFTIAGTGPGTNVLPGRRIIKAEVHIETPFDGGAPTLDIGVDTDNNKYVDQAQINLKAANSFIITPPTANMQIPLAGETIKGFFNPDGSGAGSGFIILWRLANINPVS